MSTSTKIMCDRCGEEGAAIALLISDGDPGVTISDLHVCRACAAPLADFFLRVPRDVFAGLSRYEDEILVRSAQRAMPPPKDAPPNTILRSTIEIDVRPQTAFKTRHIDIERPQDWVLNHVVIGNRSQFNQSGDVPAESLASSTGMPIDFEPCSVGMKFQICATYVGSNPEGAHFVAKLIGTSVGFPPKKS
jgi:hypothetical protein